MKVHTLEINVLEDQKQGNGANLKIEGSPLKIAQAICGLLQNNLEFRHLIFEALINSIGPGPLNVTEYKSEKDVKP